jgi:small-conductance mechanosensitive channel
LVFALLAAALGYVTGNERQANTEFDQTHYTLNVTTHRIDTALADLLTVRHELDVVNGQVSADSTALTQDTAQLQGVQKALSGAQAAVVHQTATIGDLQACLGGVEQALNALAVRDQAHAIDALDAVSTSCANAVTSDG